MPKYCPKCFGEFRDNMSTCPKDQTPLSNSKPEQFERLVDLYAASDEIEAEVIISFLKNNDIFAQESQTGISQMPNRSDMRYIIAVLKEELKRAKSLVEQARVDKVISTNGVFL